MNIPSAIRLAVDCFGSQAALSKAIGVRPALVWQWLNGRRPVAAQHCRGIEHATGGKVTRYDLRPDVFGAAQASACEQEARMPIVATAAPGRGEAA